MGANLSSPRISIYTKIEVNTQVSGIYEFDRVIELNYIRCFLF